MRPLRFMLALALLVLACATTLHAQPACTRYASPTGGGNGLSQGSPYTIHDFIFGSPQPGDVLCLLDGTYTQDGIELGSTPSGSPGNPITVRAINDGAAFIDGQHNHRTLFFNGTSYWTIQGIDFGNAGGGDTDGASFYPGTHHITVQRVCIWNATTPVAGTYTNSHVIAVWNAHHLFFEDICAFGWGRNTFIPFETDTKDNVFRRMWLRWDGYPDQAGAQCPGPTIQAQYHTYYTNDINENLISIFSGGLYKTLYPGGASDPNHTAGYPCPGLGGGFFTRSGLLDNSLGAHYNGFIGYGYTTNNDILGGPDGLGNTNGIGFGSRWVPLYAQDIFDDNRAARENSSGMGLGGCDTADPADPESGPNYGHDCSLLHADRLTHIRNTNQYAGSAASTATNFNDCTSLAACPNFYTGTSPGTGSRACFEYNNGTLTSTPLWPWRMDDRIKQALARSGIAPTLTGTAGPGYAANTVTSEIVARYGAVPAQCSRAGAVAGVPAITSSLTVSGLVGTAFSYQITATNSPTSYGATGLPAGLSVSSSTGLISGTPTAAGTSSVTLSATNANGTGNATLTLTLTMASNITVREIPFGDVNTSGKTISSCWGGLGKDTSNRLYIAMGVGPSATADSDDVALFQYTPVTGGAIGTRTFLDTLKHVTQLENNFDASETIAKVHTELIPLGGKLYFASHDFHDVAPGTHRGAHFFSYDPAANHFEDLSKTDPGGVSAPGEGIIGMDIMLPQNKLIGFTYKPGDGGNVVAYDLAAHSSVYWAGNPNPDAGVSRRIFTSHDQLAYISYGNSGGPQQIYAMNVTNGAITAPAGMTLRTAQIPAVARANDGDRVFLMNWDFVYLWHTTSKQFESLGELLPAGDRGRNLTAQNVVLSQDETKLYAIAEGYLDNNPSNYVWRLYQFDVATHASVLLADLTSQMAGINGGRVGSSLGAVLDAQGRFYTCSAEVGLLLEVSGLPSTAPPTPQGAWWKFDENTGTTAADSTGNSHTITLNAGAGWTAPGRIGPAALHCLGQTQPPSVTDVGFSSGTYTWMGWFKGDSAPVNTSFNSPMANGPTNVGTDAWGLWWAAQGSPDPSGSIFHRDATGLNLFKLSPALLANTWYHLAASFDGATLRSYMNGQVKGTVGVGAPVTPSGPLQVCGRYFLTPWAGNIDQLKVTDHALSDAEILAEFQQGSQVATQRRHRRIVP